MSSSVESSAAAAGIVFPGAATHHSQSPNCNIAPVSTTVNADNRLCINDRVLSELAAEFGTPLYVLDECSLRTSMRAYREALKQHYPGESLAIFASKANACLATAALVKSEGLGWDAVSEGELLTARTAGIPSERIVLHGNNKSVAELKLAIEMGVMIILDNWHDVHHVGALLPSRADAAPVRVMIRFTPGIECHTHEYIRTGHTDSKFGFSREDVERVLIELQSMAGVVLQGLHCHIGSQIFELQPHADLASVIADMMVLARTHGHSKCTDFNIGGGLGIRYVHDDKPPSIQDWVSNACASVVSACQSRGLNQPWPRLLCEPGRSLVGSAGVTLYTLGAVKHIPQLDRTYISIDGGMSDNPRPITYRSAYTALLADHPLAPNTQSLTVAGKHCESGDVLLPRVSLPDTKSGDILCVFATGAYNYSMSSNYNRIPRPAAVLVRETKGADGMAPVEIVIKRELPMELLDRDVVPSWL